MSLSLSPAQRDLAFLTGFTAFFLVPFFVYTARVGLGLSKLPPPRARGSGRRLVAPLLIGYFYWLTKPLCRLAVRSGRSASFFTALGLVGASLTALAIATGHFALGAALLIAAGALDVMDGEVARTRGQSSARGAFLDSTIDRVADGLIFGGAVVYYAGTLVMYAALLALIMSFVISYARSRAESLGLTGAEGLMQRGDRIALLSIALAFSPLPAHRSEGFVAHPFYGVTAGALVLLALLNTGTAVARIVWTMRRLASARPGGRDPAPAGRRMPPPALRGQPNQAG
ncbi:MAG TPA: CDP-alcohol phosphatidyltransferase family protein [Polyangia bacterium]|nr:CDP-alcohol phosphatidyltransferase family protein [Polyangia bacterium]